MTIWDAIWKSFVLGAVQGLTEFLPVSSSGHLTLLQRAMDYDAGGSMMFINIMLHLGTLISVVVVFRKQIAALFKKPFKMLFMLLVATIPAGLVGVLFSDKIDEIFAGERGIMLLSVCFAATALILLLCEFAAKRRKSTCALGWGNAVMMGVMQAVALFPGISRSGSTIAAGTVSGAKSDDVANFSFLMSIPVILGSFLVSVFGIVKDAVGGDQAVLQSFGASSIVGIIVGVVASAVTGFLAIKLMLKVIKRANYKWFSLYLILLSLTILFLDIAKIL